MVGVFWLVLIAVLHDGSLLREVALLDGFLLRVGDIALLILSLVYRQRLLSARREKLDFLWVVHGRVKSFELLLHGHFLRRL